MFDHLFDELRATAQHDSLGFIVRHAKLTLLCFLESSYHDTLERVPCLEILNVDCSSNSTASTTVYAINDRRLSALVTENASEFFNDATVSISDHTDAPVYYYVNRRQGPLCVYEFRIGSYNNMNMYILYLPLRREMFFLAGNNVVEEQNLFLLTILEWFSIFDDMYVMHASSVEYKSRVIAFVGNSGAGKTSLSLKFAQLGGRILSDDQVVMVPPSQVVPIHNPTLGLGIGTIRHFGLSKQLLPGSVLQQYDRLTPEQLYSMEGFDKVRIPANQIKTNDPLHKLAELNMCQGLTAIVFPRIDVNAVQPFITKDRTPKARLFRYLKP